MSQGDQFHQYGYDHYLKAPKKQGGHRRDSYSHNGGNIISSLLRSFGASSIFHKLQNPIVVGGVLGCAILLFIGVITVTCFSDDGVDKAIPIVKADLGNIKQTPNNPGGMDIPYRQSTILARSDQPTFEVEAKTVENLLANQEYEDLVSKEEAINRAMQSPVMGGTGYSFADSAEAQDDLTALQETNPQGTDSQVQANGVVDILSQQSISVEAKETVVSGEANEALSADKAEEVEIKPAFDLEKPDTNDILQKIGSSKGSNSDGEISAHFSDDFINMAAKSALVTKPAISKKIAAALAGNAIASEVKSYPANLHNAGQSPETLEYVRSVLNSDLNSSNVNTQSGAYVQSIEPALGASSDIEVGAGVYFVQLASITDAKRAVSEWTKMQRKYPVLVSSKFRVQEASLPGGTFYRIQAGPMSKESATQICNALKQANKPGGCLVVK